MEETKELDELQEMRQQMSLLMAKLDKETMLREEVLRKTLGRGANRLKNREIAGMYLITAVMVLMPILLYIGPFSLLFSIVTFLYFALCLTWEVVVYYSLNLGHLMEENLVLATKNLQEYKRLNNIWLYRIGLPSVFLWFIWYAWEYVGFMAPNFTGEMSRWLIICLLVGCLLVGGIIGGLIGYFTFYRPQMRLADEMMEHIQNLTAEDD